MIIGELKNKIDSLWDTFMMDDLVNPLDAVRRWTSWREC